MQLLSNVRKGMQEYKKNKFSYEHAETYTAEGVRLNPLKPLESAQAASSARLCAVVLHWVVKTLYSCSIERGSCVFYHLQRAKTHGGDNM